MRIFATVGISAIKVRYESSGVAHKRHSRRRMNTSQAPCASILCSRQPLRHARRALSSRSNRAHAPRGTLTRWAKS
jgi:hypothetical protein